MVHRLLSMAMSREEFSKELEVIKTIAEKTVTHPSWSTVWYLNNISVLIHALNNSSLLNKVLVVRAKRYTLI